MIDGKAPGELDHVPKKRIKIQQKRNTLRRLIENGTLFTYLQQKNKIPDVPKTNNAIENQNRQIRGVLEHHRGFDLYKQLQTVWWYCYKRTKMLYTISWLTLPDHAEIFLKATPSRDKLEQYLNSNETTN
ncbi:MAG: hypothetical protein Q3972_02285 [Corynebacterium sp.]|nr:hypothetical protein [Corynebacterium sp.]